MQTLDGWIKDHEEDLKPFRAFLANHGLDQEYTISSLYKMGYWGQRVMMPRVMMPNTDAKAKNAMDSSLDTTILVAAEAGAGTEEAEAGDSTVADDNVDAAEHEPRNGDGAPLDLIRPVVDTNKYHFEIIFDNWASLLESQNLPHTPDQLLARWPGMLAWNTTKVPNTVAMLRAIIPDDEQLHRIISAAPKILAFSPLSLQKRLLALRLASAGDLKSMIDRAPQLLSSSLHTIMTNVRFLRETANSFEEYKHVISRRPDIICFHPRQMIAISNSMIQTLQNTLPDAVDARGVVSFAPQLMFMNGKGFRERYDSLLEIIVQVPRWQSEWQEILDAAALWKQRPKTLIAANDSFMDTGSNDGEIGPPEWLMNPALPIEDMPLGIGKKESTADVIARLKSLMNGDDILENSRATATQTGEDNGKNSSSSEDGDHSTTDADNDDVSGDDLLGDGDWGCSSLAEALWAHPARHDRLRFLINQGMDEASSVSFVDALVVDKERFQRRYPGFYRWMGHRRRQQQQGQRRHTHGDDGAGGNDDRDGGNDGRDGGKRREIGELDREEEIEK